MKENEARSEKAEVRMQNAEDDRNEAIQENRVIHAWAKHFSRSHDQVNKTYESDAELVAHPAFPGHFLAITIDTVAEEISQGLYLEPETVGWVTVMASLSDLAAVGAEPLGLVVSASVPAEKPEAEINRIASGMEQACVEAGVHILGGDVNSTKETSFSACSVGLVPRQRKLTRMGCLPGDIVYATGPLGIGNALGLVRLAGLPDVLFPETSYRPEARIPEGEFIAGYARSCMDSSDGLVATLDTMARLNGVGFAVECDWQKLLAPEVLRLCEATKTPKWLMTAGPHGEFELIFAVPPDHEAGYMAAARKHGFAPVRLGRVQERQALTYHLGSGVAKDVDGAFLRNLLSEVGGDMKRYLQEFFAYGKRLGLD